MTWVYLCKRCRLNVVHERCGGRSFVTSTSCSIRHRNAARCREEMVRRQSHQTRRAAIHSISWVDVQSFSVQSAWIQTNPTQLLAPIYSRNQRVTPHDAAVLPSSKTCVLRRFSIGLAYCSLVPADPAETFLIHTPIIKIIIIIIFIMTTIIIIIIITHLSDNVFGRIANKWKYHSTRNLVSI